MSLAYVDTRITAYKLTKQTPKYIVGDLVRSIDGLIEVGESVSCEGILDCARSVKCTGHGYTYTSGLGVFELCDADITGIVEPIKQSTVGGRKFL